MYEQLVSGGKAQNIEWGKKNLQQMMLVKLDVSM